MRYTLFFTPVTYINSWNVVSTDHLSQVNKHNFWNSISLLIKWFLVYLFLCYRQKVFLLKWDFFSWNWEKWSLSGIGNGAQYRPRETRWKSPEYIILITVWFRVNQKLCIANVNLYNYKIPMINKSFYIVSWVTFHSGWGSNV
jgi:hypothetical protein